MNIKGRNAERRLVTVLFADLSNFTALCHDIDPEESVRIANICFEHINGIIKDQRGMIHKYGGDSVMALFGFPVTYEDAPERAVKTGLALLDVMPEVNNSVFKETGIKCDLNLHIGIHSGLTVVAEVGSEEKKEYTVMGDTVNLASRLKDIAPAGKVFVSEQIFKATEYLFEYREAESCSIKGIESPVRVFQPLATRRILGAKRGIKGLHSPLVGRGKEFEKIKDKIQKLREAKGGILFVTGDAGIGKSRLWQETKNYVYEENLDIGILEGQCVYHGEHLSYWPVLQILEGIYAITDKDNQETIKQKIIEKTSQLLDEKWRDVVPYIGHLFSLRFSDELAEKVKYLDPRELQIKVLWSIKTLLWAISAKTPVILTIEDYHWIDSASLQLIQYLFGSPDTYDMPNVMLLCLSREGMDEEFVHVKEKLKDRSPENFTEIKLDPLDRYSTLELTYNLLEIPGFSKDFKNKVLSKAEGNPFFLEEIINSLIESGVIYFEAGTWKQRKKVEEIEIPDTIQLVIAARLDRLGEDLRNVLQMASVIGRTFYQSILAEIHKDKERLIRYLDALEGYEFILQLITSGQSAEDIEYMFKHPLIQQVTYTSLLKSQRRKLHRTVAETMEVIYKDRIDDFVGLIAHQYAASDDHKKAVQWLQKAGKKAKAGYANEDALEYYGNIISIINENGMEDSKALIAAYESIADIYKNLGKNAESIENYTRVLEISDDVLTHARIIRKIGDTYQKQSRYKEALEYLSKSKDKLDELSPRTEDEEASDRYYVELHTIYHSLAWVNYLVGDFDTAQAYCNKSLAEISNIKDKRERNLSYASTINIIAAIKTRTGHRDETFEYYRKAEKIYEEEGDLAGLGTVYNNCVNYYSEKGDYISCIKYLEKSLGISEKIGNALGEAISSFNLGAEYLNLGKYDYAREYLDRYQKINKLINNRLGQGWANESYAGLYWEEGLKDKALESIDTAIEIFAEVQSKIKEMGAKLVKADFLIDMNEYGRAEALLEEVEEYAEKNSVTDYLISIQISRGKLLLKKGDSREVIEKALAEFHKAAEIVSEMGWVSALTEVYYYIGKTMESLKDKESTKYFDMARKVLQETAGKITDEDLKRSFLEKSFNRKILAAASG